MDYTATHFQLQYLPPSDLLTRIKQTTTRLPIEISSQDVLQKHYSHYNDLIVYNNSKLYIQDLQLRYEILFANHDTLTAGHPGYT